MIDVEEVKRIAKMLDADYEEECRNRPPYALVYILISAFIVWIIAAFIICSCNNTSTQMI